MPHTIDFEGTRDLHEPHEHSSKPLDEAVWRTWLNKNLLQEKQRAATRIKAVKWVCVGVLISTAVMSPHVFAPYVSAYQAVVRFVIALGAIVIMFESLRVRQYAFTALFAGTALLFNPVVPTFALSGNWPMVITSALAFVASLIWMRERTRTIAISRPALG